MSSAPSYALGARVNVAVIGAGIGQKHINAYRTLPECFDVKTLCDVDTERAQAFLGPNASTQISDDFDAVLADPSIELVDICLPPHLHFDFTARALRAGKHVICEKPLCTSLEDVDRIIEVSRQTGQRIFPNHQYRYGHGITALKALIDSGLAGRAFVGALETHWNRGAAYYAVDWRGTWAGEQGGVVLGHAIHMHDLLSYILGPVGSVFAQLDTRVNPIEVEDCGALSFKMASGALATSSVTLGGGNDTTRLRFCFEGVTAQSGELPYTPAEGAWTFTARDPVKQADIDAVVAKVEDRPGGQAGFALAVYETLRGKTADIVTLDDARRSIELVTAIYQSARTQLPTALPLGEDAVGYAGWLPQDQDA